MHLPNPLKNEIISFLVKCSYCNRYWNKIKSFFVYYKVDFNERLGGLGVMFYVPKILCCRSCGMRTKKHIMDCGILDLKHKWIRINNIYYESGTKHLNQIASVHHL